MMAFQAGVLNFASLSVEFQQAQIISDLAGE